MLERQTATSRPLCLPLILLGTLLSEVFIISCHNKLFFLVFQKHSPDPKNVAKRYV